MEDDYCKIVLDKATNTYHSGQTIFGTITLLKYKGKKIRSIFFRITGHGKCSWSTLLRKESTAPSTNTATDELAKDKDRSMHMSGEEDYLTGEVIYIAGSKHGPQFQINQDTVSYSFRYDLKHMLPSSFKGTYGKIKYEMEFTIDRKWKLDRTYKVPLTIYKSLDLNFDPYAGVPQQKQLTRNIGLLHSGPISLHLLIPRTGFACGEKLPIQVIVSNNSSTHVDKVKFTLRKIIDYHSKAPARVTKQEIIKMLKKEAGGVEKKSEQKYEHLLDVPDLPASDKMASNIIHISYDIVVEVKISGLYKNLVESVPVTIGSIALQNIDLPPWSATIPGDHAFESMPALPTAQPMPMPALPRPQPMSTSMPMPMPNSSMYPSLPAHLDYTYPPAGAGAGFSTSSPIPNQANEPRRSVGNAPSAPPLDFYSVSPTSTRSSICADAPPSYRDVFGSPNHQQSMSMTSSMSITSSLSSLSMSASQTFHQESSNSTNPFENTPSRDNENRASIPPPRRRRRAEAALQNSEDACDQRFILAEKDFCNKVPVAAP